MLKPVRLLLVFILLIFFKLGIAQNSLLDQNLQTIDSLIQYNHFDLAQKETDSLIFKLQNKEQQNLLVLELKYRNILILDRLHKSISEPLPFLFALMDKAEEAQYHSLLFRIHLLIALCYEKSGNFDLEDKYLNSAYQIYKKQHLEELYSTYCIRRSSYFRFMDQLDSVYYYANQANEYAQMFRNESDLIDSYVLLTFVSSKRKDYGKALNYASKLKDYRVKYRDKPALASSYNSIAKNYLNLDSPQKALLYNDSAFLVLNTIADSLRNSVYIFPELRYRIFESLGNIDSAFFYLKKYQQDWIIHQEREEKIKAKQLEEQFQNAKKESIIESKNQQIVFIASLLLVIVIATVLLIRKNLLISKQNKTIHKQINALSRTLEQKQILLSELQHRVKNNLQHVISILEIQKESVDFNNIDELIRGNQNRIHSMALLHKKLNVFDHVNDVDLTRYIDELSILVRDSYNDHKKEVNLYFNCDIEFIPIEKALSIGLIIVELVSNSMKHAFKNQNIGIIDIEITRFGTKNRIYYHDNGCGYDFNKVNERGLGQEIIKGLIDQLDGDVETNYDHGFEILIYFN